MFITTPCCRCTKVGALLLTPLLVHGQSEPRATATLRRAEEGSRRRSHGTRQPKQCQDQKHKEQECKVGLPGRPPQPRQEPCRGTCQTPVERAFLEPKVSKAINHIGTKAREALPWRHADLCKDQMRTRRRQSSTGS